MKLIDLGAVTFDYNYMIAYTPLYFPTSDYDPTVSKEKR